MRHCFSLLVLIIGMSCFQEIIRAETPDEAKWTSLFDGQSLKGWTQTQFGGSGEILVDKGHLVIEQGNPLNGVTMTYDGFKPIPKVNYELRVKALREIGGDFFVGLTFPVNDQYCSLIMGGWGGGVIGISSIDGYDAAENETTTYATFKNGQWYDVLLRVTEQKITVWLDKEQVIDVEVAGRKLNTRIEVDQSIPFGMATFETQGRFDQFQIRKLPVAIPE
ncbi:MAG: DUF1080 domain-containing protein [Planctomycetaceae bacterium]|nr:DUF1080 domain-containing protein [Planctomycetaceae bacterium]